MFKIVRETEAHFFVKRHMPGPPTHRVHKDDRRYHLDACPRCPDTTMTIEDRFKAFPFTI
jgi:hypothetical protein